MSDLTTLATDFRVVAVDETHHWDKEIQDVCGSIKTVYLFDKSVQTFCCEITPSYALTPLYYITENEVSDEMWETLHNELPHEVSYYHCRVIDELETESPNNNIDFESSESEEYLEHFEEVREYCNGNHLI